MKSRFCLNNQKKTLCYQAGLFFVLLIVSSLLVLTSCTKKSANFSFATSMDTVDSMIALGQMKEANDLLKDASTVASEPNEWFAIYKRYIRTGNTKEAGKLMKKAYKKCSGNAEVAAVYAHHLIQEKNYDDAYKVAVRLENTPYGSILSELRLKKAKAENNYLKREFVQTFCDAAYATGNDRYLRNAAVIEA
jgi:Tfp pilus assembly protein PilF